MNIPQGYESLAAIHRRALEQAAYGKGVVRHAQGGKSFDQQPIVELARMVGPGGPAQQVMKKTQEAMRLPPEQAVAELLGAINYAAAAIIVIEERLAYERAQKEAEERERQERTSRLSAQALRRPENAVNEVYAPQTGADAAVASLKSDTLILK